jgi:ubiquinone biosynthesis protein Coq4
MATNDLQLQVLSSVAAVSGKVDNLNDDIAKLGESHAITKTLQAATDVKLTDHETRLRALETFHNKTLGMSVIVSLLAGVLGTLVIKALGGH